MSNQLENELRQLEFLNAQVTKISEELYKDRQGVADSLAPFASIEWVNKHILKIPEKEEILKVKDWKNKK